MQQDSPYVWNTTLKENTFQCCPLQNIIHTQFRLKDRCVWCLNGSSGWESDSNRVEILLPLLTWTPAASLPARLNQQIAPQGCRHHTLYIWNLQELPQLHSPPPLGFTYLCEAGRHKNNSLSPFASPWFRGVAQVTQRLDLRSKMKSSRRLTMMTAPQLLLQMLWHQRKSQRCVPAPAYKSGRGTLFQSSFLPPSWTPPLYPGQTLSKLFYRSPSKILRVGSCTSPFHLIHVSKVRQAKQKEQKYLDYHSTIYKLR